MSEDAINCLLSRESEVEVASREARSEQSKVQALWGSLSLTRSLVCDQQVNLTAWNLPGFKYIIFEAEKYQDTQMPARVNQMFRNTEGYFVYTIAFR